MSTGFHEEPLVLRTDKAIELCHNWGTETDPEFKGYANGNSEPGRGFGHIAIVRTSCSSPDQLPAYSYSFMHSALIMSKKKPIVLLNLESLSRRDQRTVACE